MDYLVLTERSDVALDARNRLSSVVRVAMDNGYRCQGGIDLAIIHYAHTPVVKYIYSQALVREETP